MPAPIGHPCPSCSRPTLGTPSPGGGRFPRCPSCVHAMLAHQAAVDARLRRGLGRIVGDVGVQMQIPFTPPAPTSAPGTMISDVPFQLGRPIPQASAQRALANGGHGAGAPRRSDPLVERYGGQYYTGSRTILSEPRAKPIHLALYGAISAIVGPPGPSRRGTTACFSRTPLPADEPQNRPGAEVLDCRRDLLLRRARRLPRLALDLEREARLALRQDDVDEALGASEPPSGAHLDSVGAGRTRNLGPRRRGG
mgnify:CR=1 FL=1